jgi:hypothetical protein
MPSRGLGHCPRSRPAASAPPPGVDDSGP